MREKSEDNISVNIASSDIFHGAKLMKVLKPSFDCEWIT